MEYTSKNGFRFHHSVSTAEGEQNEYLARSESHYLYELFWLLSGDVQYTVNGKTFVVSAGDVLLLAPETVHSMRVHFEKCDYERMVLHFSSDLLPRFNDVVYFDALNDEVQLFPSVLVKKSKLPALFKRFEEACTNSNKYLDLQLYREVLCFVEELDKLLLEAFHLQETISDSVITNKISYACTQYIRKHMDQYFSLPELAKALNISVSYLAHAFKKEMGLSLNKYIMTQKMRLAQKRLEQGDPPQQVALSLGYEYYSTFYHQYQKFYSISPGEQYSLPHTRKWMRNQYPEHF